MVEAMVREVAHRNPDPSPTQTWYWGGGTPSLLSVEQARHLVDHLHRHGPLDAGGEFTLEANPEDLTSQNLRAWRDMGVNRLSLGIQSFVDERLIWMNRAHTGQQAREGVYRAQDAGFENISVDLIYGLPYTALEEWQDNVGQALELGIPHLSTYALTVEEKTALHHQIKKGQSSAPKDERAAEDFLWLRRALRENDWEPYELSNASKPGKRARHNSAYWAGEAYMGIGPGAHSFDGVFRRQWNVSHNLRYIQAWNSGQSMEDTVQVELLSPKDRLNELIMTNLRRVEGLSRSEMGAYAAELDRRWAVYVQEGWVLPSEHAWALTDEGCLWMDRIALEGFATAVDLGIFVQE